MEWLLKPHRVRRWPEEKFDARDFIGLFAVPLLPSTPLSLTNTQTHDIDR